MECEYELEYILIVVGMYDASSGDKWNVKIIASYTKSYLTDVLCIII